MRRELILLTLWLLKGLLQNCSILMSYSLQQIYNIDETTVFQKRITYRT